MADPRRFQAAERRHRLAHGELAVGCKRHKNLVSPVGAISEFASGGGLSPILLDPRLYGARCRPLRGSGLVPLRCSHGWLAVGHMITPATRAFGLSWQSS